MIDTIVQEVRKIREQDAKEHDFDLIKIASAIKQHENQLAQTGWKMRKIIVNKSFQRTADRRR